MSLPRARPRSTPAAQSCQVNWFIQLQEQCFLIISNVQHSKPSSSDQVTDQRLQGKIRARKRVAKLGSRLLRINRRQRLSAIGYLWNNSAPGLDLSAKKL